MRSLFLIALAVGIASTAPSPAPAPGIKIEISESPSDVVGKAPDCRRNEECWEQGYFACYEGMCRGHPLNSLAIQPPICREDIQCTISGYFFCDFDKGVCVGSPHLNHLSHLSHISKFPECYYDWHCLKIGYGRCENKKCIVSIPSLTISSPSTLVDTYF